MHLFFIVTSFELIIKWKNLLISSTLMFFYIIVSLPAAPASMNIVSVIATGFKSGLSISNFYYVNISVVKYRIVFLTIRLFYLQKVILTASDD